MRARRLLGPTSGRRARAPFSRCPLSRAHISGRISHACDRRGWQQLIVCEGRPRAVDCMRKMYPLRVSKNGRLRRGHGLPSIISLWGRRHHARILGETQGVSQGLQQ